MGESIELHVRAATVGDLPRLGELFVAYRIFYGQAADPGTAADFLARRLEAKDSQIFVAEAGGSIRGFAQLYPMLSSISMRRVWVLNDLYVDEAHRQEGVAGALLDRSASFLKETGASRLEVKTARNNQAAQALYEKHGWRRDDVFIDYFLVGD
jgi:ribosomal protein S18 acetylase RimI-like enzyme